MKHSAKALLQERIRTLVLTHAIEATLSRLIALSGCDAVEELTRLEHRITAASRMLGTVPGQTALTTMVAVEDAIGTISSAFDRAHDRPDASTVPAAPLAA